MIGEDDEWNAQKGMLSLCGEINLIVDCFVAGISPTSFFEINTGVRWRENTQAKDENHGK